MRDATKDQGYDAIAKAAMITDNTFNFEQAIDLMRRVCSASGNEIWPAFSGNEIHALVNLAVQETKKGGAL